MFTPAKMARFTASTGKAEIGQRTPALDGSPQTSLTVTCNNSSKPAARASSAHKTSAVREAVE
jgi:hypothetical protein